MPLQSYPVFPVEIFQLIIDDLVDHDDNDCYARFGQYWALSPPSLQDMKSCCLVSQSFVPLCRRYIFKHISFGPYGSLNTSCRNLTRLFLDQPYLASYVQKVSFEFNIGFNVDETFIDESILTVDHTLGLWELLRNLKDLAIDHTSCYAYQQRGDIYTPCGDEETCVALARDVLDRFCPSPALRTITLSGLHISMQPLLMAPNLENLQISNCVCNGWDVRMDTSRPDGPFRPGCLPLKILELDHVQDFALNMLNWCDSLESIHMENVPFEVNVPIALEPAFKIHSFPQLRHIDLLDSFIFATLCGNESWKADADVFPAVQTLWVATMGEVEDDMNTILDCTSHSVEHLVVDVGCPSQIELYLIPCLRNCHRTLTHVEFSINAHSEYDEALVYALINALDEIKGDNVLEAISLSLTISSLDRGPPPLEVPIFPDLRQLDELLLEDRSTDFPSLGLVEVSVTFDSTQFDTNGEPEVNDSLIYADYLREPLARLYTTSDIEFVFTYSVT